jgi:hypothetical protein
VETEVRALRERGVTLRGGSTPESRPVDPELLEQLEALGYAEAR